MSRAIGLWLRLLCSKLGETTDRTCRGTLTAEDLAKAVELLPVDR